MRKRLYGMALLAAVMVAGCAGTDTAQTTAETDVVTTAAENVTEGAETTVAETTVAETTETEEATSETTAETTEETEADEETTVAKESHLSEAKDYTEPEDKDVKDVAGDAVENLGLTFSHDSGCYSDAFKLSISSTDGGTVYFTLDGSDPRYSENVYKYSDEIVIYNNAGDENVMSAVDPDLFDTAYAELDKDTGEATSRMDAPDTEDVDKCMVVRAISVDAEGNTQGVVNKTYFVGDMTEHIEGIEDSCAAAGQSLAIVNICIDYDDMFDAETGIYVKGNIFIDYLAKYLKKAERTKKYPDPEDFRKYAANYSQRGRAWEREVGVTVLESDGTTTEAVISQQAGVRIQGNYSRSDLMKGFRLYARSEYGENRFKYEIWSDLTDENGETIDSFKTITLRNGGNGAFANKFADTYWQSMIGDLDVSTQASRPAIVYINGEYWGLYVLQEDYSSEYFEDHYAVNSDDVVLYKGDAETYDLGYKLDLGELPEGETKETYYFQDLLDFFNSHDDCSSDEDYEEFCRIVDPDSVLDYFATEVWINNKWDWPGKNWSMWKTLTVDETNAYNDGRWRFCVYDVEFGGVSGSSDATTNTIKEDNYTDNGLLNMTVKNPAAKTFAYLMTNADFRQRFCDKLLSMSDNEFQYDKAIEILDNFSDIYSPLYDQFFARYEGTGSANACENGGYFSVKCVKDFLAKRAGYIQKMIDWTNKVYE